MSAFVNTLRARRTPLVLGGADAMTVRVQLLEAWDAVQVQAGAATSVAAVKAAAFAALGHPQDDPSDFEAKMHGHLIGNEANALSDIGARDGSTVILVRRRRRPVH